MSNNDNSSSINGIKSIINKAPSSLNDNNQDNNQEVHNQAPVPNQNIKNNKIENIDNNNKENPSKSVDYGEKIDNMNEKLDKMGSDISKIKEDINGIKTRINTMYSNITGLRTEVRKGLNNLVFANYLIAMMLFLIISIIIYQIKNNN